MSKFAPPSLSNGSGGGDFDNPPDLGQNDDIEVSGLLVGLTLTPTGFFEPVGVNLHLKHTYTKNAR